MEKTQIQNQTTGAGVTPAQEIYTVAQVGKIFGLSRNATYEAVKRGEIPSIKIGGAIRVPRIALDRLLTSA